MAYRFLRYPGGKFKAVTLSYDDGSKRDLELLEIIDKYDMKCTLNICSSLLDRDGRLTSSDIEERVYAKGHEIANHGARHIALGITDSVTGICDILNCRKELEEKLGKIIRGNAYPDTMKNISGEKYKEINAMLKSVGIVYSRIAGGDNDNFDLPTDFHIWMPTAHHDNPKIFEFIDKFSELDDKKLYGALRWPRLFYMWGHSSEFGTFDRLHEICKKLSGREDTWYATNIEIYDYVKAYESLVFSFDGKTVYNPTLLDIWFDIDRTVYCVKSGETLEIK